MNITTFEELPANIRQKITQQIYSGNKIAAIQCYREITGCYLVEAKLVIEKVEKDLRFLTPDAFRQNPANQTEETFTAAQALAVGVILAIGLAGTAILDDPDKWIKKISEEIGVNQVDEVTTVPEKTVAHPVNEVKTVTEKTVTQSQTESKKSPEPASYSVLRLPFDGKLEDVVSHLKVYATDTVTHTIEFVDGRFGQAVQFDGSGEELEVTGIGKLPISTEMTLEVWVNAPNWRNPYEGSPPLGSVVSRGIFYSIGVWYHSRKAQAVISTNPTAKNIVSLEGGLLEPDRWHHIALVYSDKAGRVRLFVDGKRVDEKELHGAIVASDGIPLTIGTWYQRNQAFKGWVDEIRLSNVALDDETIRSHAQTN